MSCDAVVHCAGGWGAWSGCSALCGGGTRSQAYSVSTEARNGGRDCAAAAGDTRVQPCNIEPCPVNCEGAWGTWGQCDRPCGGGEQSRSYSVTTASAHGGIPCVAEQWQPRSCNTAACGAPSVTCMGRWGLGFNSLIVAQKVKLAASRFRCGAGSLDSQDPESAFLCADSTRKCNRYPH